MNHPSPSARRITSIQEQHISHMWSSRTHVRHSRGGESMTCFTCSNNVCTAIVAPGGSVTQGWQFAEFFFFILTFCFLGECERGGFGPFLLRRIDNELSMGIVQSSSINASTRIYVKHVVDLRGKRTKMTSKPFNLFGRFVLVERKATHRLAVS